MPLYGNEGQKQDKFILTSQPEQLKCIVTLTGDSITHAVSTTLILFFFLKSNIFKRIFTLYIAIM